MKQSSDLTKACCLSKVARNLQILAIYLMACNNC